MAKINKTNFARGAKLSSQHIANNLTPIEDLFVDNKLDRANLAETKVPFYTNFYFTGFAPNSMGLTDEQKINGTDGNLVFPIPLIPTQDHFSPEGRLTTSTPVYLLDSVSISFDQRGEGAAMTNAEVNPPLGTMNTKRWKINYEIAQEQDVQLSLIQKDFKILNQTNEYPNNSIFTTTIPAAIAFAGSENRVENPYYIFGINKQINPYKSYYLAFNFTNLFYGIPDEPVDPRWWISNLIISFKFYTVLDTYEEETDNTINKSQANATDSILSYVPNLSAPAAYSTITAETATGLQTNLNKIDELVEEKLTTGYSDKFGTLGSVEETSLMNRQAIDTPAVYDVMVVPFWQGSFGASGAITTAGGAGMDSPLGDVAGGAPMPSSNTISYSGPVQDIRTIPLFYPFTVHHVLAWHNQQIKRLTYSFDKEIADFGYGTTTGGIIGKVGVGLGTCFQSDRYTYDQIAYLEYDKNFANVIDEIRMSNNIYSRINEFGPAEKIAGRLMQVSLSNAGGGTGFYPQGVPFYCGGGTKRFETRSGLGIDTIGMENFIEIRWQFEKEEEDTIWWDNTTAVPDPEIPQCIAGFGGHFVYLIGKKLLTTNRNNIQE